MDDGGARRTRRGRPGRLRQVECVGVRGDAGLFEQAAPARDLVLVVAVRRAGVLFGGERDQAPRSRGE
jgi:hypothetical protein